MKKKYFEVECDPECKIKKEYIEDGIGERIALVGTFTVREVPDREEQGKLLEEAINYIQWQITLKKAVGTECPKAEALVAHYEAAKKESL